MKVGVVVVVEGKGGGRRREPVACEYKRRSGPPAASKVMVHTRSSARSKPVARLSSNPRDQYRLAMAATVILANFGLCIVLSDRENGGERQDWIFVLQDMRCLTRWGSMLWTRGPLVRI